MSSFRCDLHEMAVIESLSLPVLYALLVHAACQEASIYNKNLSCDK
jgi:hypothetical protein